MKDLNRKITYIAFLRGINVGGHHKVPMAELKNLLVGMGCENVSTILNSGNIIFDFNKGKLLEIEDEIRRCLETNFGFSIPTILRTAAEILELYHQEPFADIVLTKELRFYVSFLIDAPKASIEIPWHSDDKSFRILKKVDRTIVSVLDLSISQTPKAMKALEDFFGKGITTRNWNTIKRIARKLNTDS